MVQKTKKEERYPLVQIKPSEKKELERTSFSQIKSKPAMIIKAPSPFPASPPASNGNRNCPTPDLVSTGADSPDSFDEAAEQLESIVPAQQKKPRPAAKKWEEREDQILMECQAKLGNQWNEIIALLPGRTKGSAQHRWRAKAFKERMQRGEIVASADVIALVAAHVAKVVAINSSLQAKVARKRPNPFPVPSSKSPEDVSPKQTAAASGMQRAVLAKTGDNLARAVASCQTTGTSNLTSRGPPPFLPSVQPPSKKLKIGSPTTATAIRPSHHSKKEHVTSGATKMPKSPPHAQALPKPRPQPQQPRTSSYPKGAFSVVAAKHLAKAPLDEKYQEVVAKDFFGAIPVSEPYTVIMHRPLPLATESKNNGSKGRPKAKPKVVQWNFDDPDRSIGNLPFDHPLEDAFWAPYGPAPFAWN